MERVAGTVGTVAAVGTFGVVLALLALATLSAVPVRFTQDGPATVETVATMEMTK
jgi:hypothetical protein